MEDRVRRKIIVYIATGADGFIARPKRRGGPARSPAAELMFVMYPEEFGRPLSRMIACRLGV